MADAAANHCMDAAKKSPEKAEEGDTNPDILLQALKPIQNHEEIVFSSVKTTTLDKQKKKPKIKN